jgi:predicted  nucleic acid-binding Zn-ribbon protein
MSPTRIVFSREEEKEMEARLNKVDDAIKKLAEISNELNKSNALIEQKMFYHEKQHIVLENKIEKMEQKIERDLTKLQEILKEDSQNLKKNISTIQEKIQYFEKLIWMVAGGSIVTSFIISKWNFLISLIK